MRLLSKRIMTNEVAKHKNNEIEAAQHKYNSDETVKHKSNDR